jgi:hypothetical protein
MKIACKSVINWRHLRNSSISLREDIVLLYRKSKHTLNSVFHTEFNVDARIFSFSPLGFKKI